MKRTRLSDRRLPDYTRGEEIFNMVSHIVGAAMGVFAAAICIMISVGKGDAWAAAGSAVYGASLIILYTVSSVYHGLKNEKGKKVMQVIDHCVIYLLIAGTYTPILLTAIRRVSPPWAWIIFGLVWGLAALGAALTAVDLKKYSKFSMACYIGMGWCIVLAAKPALEGITPAGLLWLFLGGVAYTVGAAIYGLGKRRRYMHSVFHLFVLAGSAMQLYAVAGHII